MNRDEKECPDCAEIIKQNAKVCRYCGFRFSESEVAENVGDAVENQAIDEAIMAAMPFYAKTLRGSPILYGGGEREMSVTRGRLEELANATGRSFEQLRERFESLGWVFVESDAEAETRSQEKHEEWKRARTLAQAEAFKARHSADNQYGVLQPAANATAGCFALWQWVILIFIVALIAVAVKSLFE